MPHDAGDVVSGKVLVNAAYQHTLFRLLEGVSALTGEPRYRAAAERSLRFLLQRAVDPSGLLLWGGHVALEASSLRPVVNAKTGWAHELKHHYPAYELMWAADRDATTRYIEALWNAHVLDWSTLDFNRHGRYQKARGRIWESEYRGGPVGFWGQGLTFVNTGSDLYYAAGVLGALDAQTPALDWAKRLARRYVETRKPGVGLSAYQFSQSARAHCDGPGITGDRAAYQLAELVGPGHIVLESTLFRPRPIVQRVQLRLAELLGASGKEFLDWAIEELAAWLDVAYRASDNGILPMLTDGLSLEGLTLTKNGYFGPAGRRLSARAADADFCWTFAHAFRVSGESRFAEVALRIAHHLGNAECRDERALCGVLELQRASQLPELVDLACAIGENLLSDWERELGSADARVELADQRPLALLWLWALLEGRPEAAPAFIGQLGRGADGW